LAEVVASFGEKARAATAAPATEPADEDVQFPEAAADAPDEAAEEILEDFEFLEDWEQRYQYLLDLGSKLPPMPQAWKTEANRVHGCQSTVHLVLRRDPNDAERVQFVADSDSALVQGLIGLLQRVFSGQRAEDVLGFDVAGFFTKLGLEQHLTMGRRNGLHAMVRRIRTLAGEQEQA